LVEYRQGLGKFAGVLCFERGNDYLELADLLLDQDAVKWIEFEMPVNRHREIAEMLIGINSGCLLAILLLLGFPFICLGSFFLYLGASSALLQASLNQEAIETIALIHSSQLVRPVGARNDSSSFIAGIEFSYEFEGVTHKSERVWVVEETGSEAAIQSVVDRFPTGVEVTALIDPKNPEFAFLERRWSMASYVSIALGGLPFSFVAALAILLTGWKDPRRSMICAFLVFGAVALVVLVAASHFVFSVPSEFRAAWVYWVLIGSGLFACCPLLTLGKVAKLNKIYQKALSEKKRG
jgi:hypothetical protein